MQDDCGIRLGGIRALGIEHIVFAIGGVGIEPRRRHRRHRHPRRRCRHRRRRRPMHPPSTSSQTEPYPRAWLIRGTAAEISRVTTCIFRQGDAAVPRERIGENRGITRQDRLFASQEMRARVPILRHRPARKHGDRDPAGHAYASAIRITCLAGTPAGSRDFLRRSPCRTPTRSATRVGSGQSESAGPRAPSPGGVGRESDRRQAEG